MASSKFSITLLLLQFAKHADLVKVFTPKQDSRYPITPQWPYLSCDANGSPHVCALKCLKRSDCGAFAIIQWSNCPCQLYGTIFESAYQQSTAYYAIYKTYIYVLKWLPAIPSTTGGILFVANNSFVVPENVATLRVLAIGGGGGGSPGSGGGGGSGYVTFKIFNSTPGTNYSVQIGNRGAVASNGYPTTLTEINSTSSVVVANGGYGGTNTTGGSGGSCGGAGVKNFPNTSSRCGGDSFSCYGAVGYLQANGYYAYSYSGSSQSFVNFLGYFTRAAITFGSHSHGRSSTDIDFYGGGGGGGLLVNGNGPFGGQGGCCANATSCGSTNAYGYGSGGAGGCFSNGTAYGGGAGAAGFLYIEYY